MSTTLVSRFLLDLQAANRNALDAASQSSTKPADTGTLVFERVIGSLASSIPLGHGSRDELEDSSEDERTEVPHTREDDAGTPQVDFEVLRNAEDDIIEVPHLRQV